MSLEGTGGQEQGCSHPDPESLHKPGTEAPCVFTDVPATQSKCYDNMHDNELGLRWVSMRRGRVKPRKSG
jgi:hypothetical protein